MKKFYFTLLFGLVCLFGFAQKRYVSIYVNLNDATSNWVTARISGDVPQGVQTYYAATYDRKTEGDIINMLADRGFVIERISGVGDTHSIIIMSSSPNDDSGIVTNMISSSEPNGIEIARYNLQGIKIDEDEPGVQIIVYSNYATKVIVNN